MKRYTKHAMDVCTQSRYNFIKENIGFGKTIAKFHWDKGHPNGTEIHFVTNTGIVIVTNEKTHRIITYLIARPQQIKRYYDKYSLDVPEYLLDIAKEHQIKGWNEI